MVFSIRPANSNIGGSRLRRLFNDLLLGRYTIIRLVVHIQRISIVLVILDVISIQGVSIFTGVIENEKLFHFVTTP